MLSLRESVLISLVALAAVAAPISAMAQTTGPAAAIFSGKDLSLALTQLADDDPAVRQAGQDQIVQIGPDAIDPLKQLIATTADVEQRTGAQAALARILEQAAIGPTLITLKMDHATPAQIVAELARQSRVAIRYESADAALDKNKNLSIHLDHQPFWKAVREMCLITGANIQSAGRGDSLILGQGGYDVSGPCVIDGPFMIVALSINMSSNIQLNQPGNVNRNESVEFTCFAEPKLQLSEHPYSVRLSEAIDDTGKSLLVPAQDENDDSYNNDSQAIWQASASLVVPELAAKKIKRLQGQVRLLAATKTQMLEIPDILSAKNVTQSAGSQSITVKDVAMNGDEVTVNVIINVPPNPGNISYNLAQSVRLLDASGVALENNGANGDGGNASSFHLTFGKHLNDDPNKKAGNPVKLVLPVVLESKPIECEFEFNDLPLP